MAPSLEMSVPATGVVGSLEIAALRARYESGELTPGDVVSEVYDRIAARGDDSVWISLVPREEALRAAANLPGDPKSLSLYGVPFAIKDNIDAAGMDTTAACRDFAYHAAKSATVVTRLIEAGAILIGKTNLDQFATGLNGTRSPYGAPSTPFDDSMISGGSSSGSAVAVSAGLVSFALGTDTAGSGRVPAALTSVVGIKPSRGLVSTAGIVPACRSLDCTSVLSLTVADGSRVFAVIAGPDDADPWSRALPLPPADPAADELRGRVFGVPLPEQLGFGEDSGYLPVWQGLLDTLVAAGATVQEVDFAPFFAAGALLYEGPWLAERLSGLESFIDERPDSVNPVVLALLRAGKHISGTDVFRGVDSLRELSAQVAPILDRVDALLTPTTARTFSIEQMRADPITNNAALGRFTTFSNLLDLAAIALPAGQTSRGMPFGASISAAAGSDGELLSLASAIEKTLGLRLGATGHARIGGIEPPAPLAESPATMRLAVVGAHLQGMPLNAQLRDLGAVLIEKTRTAAEYRLFALAGAVPPKPGLLRVDEDGAAIEVEVYALPTAAFGEFIAAVTLPLAIGSLRLADGSTVHGFVCEPAGLVGARDITEFGGWRAFVAVGAP